MKTIYILTLFMFWLWGRIAYSKKGILKEEIPKLNLSDILILIPYLNTLLLALIWILKFPSQRFNNKLRLFGQKITSIELDLNLKWFYGIKNH